MQVFLDQMRVAFPGDDLVLVMDRASCHTTGKLLWPARMGAVYLPRCSPELNPAERWFEPLRRTLSNTVFETVEALAEQLTGALRPYWEDEASLASLTGYPWWLDALANIGTFT